jgi:hypothetical protein
MKKNMIQIRKTIAAALLMLGALSCNNDPDADFVTREFAVTDFHTIDIDGVYEIQLVQDTVCKVTMTAPPRVLDKNTITVNDSVLTMHEKNGSHWLHPRESNSKVVIHVNHLKRMNVHEACSLFTAGPLGHTTDEIGMVVDYAKMMEADLELDCATFYYWNDPNGAYLKLRGRTENLKLWNTGLAQVDASALTAMYVLADNGSQGSLKVRAMQTLEYKLTNIGNISYFGSPPQINTLGNTGTGQLIKAD